MRKEIKRMSQEMNNRVNNKVYSDVWESCSICGRDMSNVNRIYLDIEKDTYICQVCKVKYNIYAVKCAEI
jgi:predicted SprT family Zn-dependent metalloprotease